MIFAPKTPSRNNCQTDPNLFDEFKHELSSVMHELGLPLQLGRASFMTV